MTKLKAVLFDWDGTLLDSMAVKRQGFVQAFVSYGCQPKNVETAHRQFSGLPRRVLFESTYKELFKKTLAESDYVQLEKIYVETISEKKSSLKLFPDVKPLLNQLVGKVKIFISSSMPPKELIEMVENQRIVHFFAEILGSKPGLGKGKEHVDYLVKNHRFAKDECIFVGDDEQDQILADEARVRFFKIDRSLKGKSEGILKSLREVEGLF